MRDYTVDSVLGAKSIMDDFIHDLARYNLDNASGSSFRNHMLAVYKDGVLFYSRHHVDHICGIKIASDPSAKWQLGDQNSRYSGNPHPQLIGAEWVSVWADAGPIVEGPWEPKVREVLQYYIDALDISVEKGFEEEENKKTEFQLKQATKEMEMIKKWS